MSYNSTEAVFPKNSLESPFPGAKLNTRVKPIKVIRSPKSIVDFPCLTYVSERGKTLNLKMVVLVILSLRLTCYRKFVTRQHALNS